MIDVNKDGSISLKSLFPHKDISSVKYHQLKPLGEGFVLKLYDEDYMLIDELPTKKKINCTRSLVAMVKQATNACYIHAKHDVLAKYGFNSLDEVKTTSEFDLIKEVRDEIDNQYRLNICRLQTDVLDCILLCHKKGKLGRQAITLRAITDELTRRALLNDSSRTR